MEVLPYHLLKSSSFKYYLFCAKKGEIQKPSIPSTESRGWMIETSGTLDDWSTILRCKCKLPRHICMAYGSSTRKCLNCRTVTIRLILLVMKHVVNKLQDKLDF